MIRVKLRSITIGKTYKDSESRGYDHRNKYQKREDERKRKRMNVDPGEFWDQKKQFRKEDPDNDDYAFDK